MTKIKDETLKKITKGAFIVLIGTFIGLLLGFLNRLIIIRNLTPEEYGLFSLVMVIGGIAITIASLGLYEGIAKFIAQYRAQKNMRKVKGTIISSLQISFIAGLVSFALVFFLSGLLADLFKNDLLSLPLRIYAIVIPFTIIIQTFVAVFRGFDRADIKVFFQDILLNLSILLSLGIILLIGLSLMKVIFAYISAILFVFLVFSLFSFKKYIQFMIKHRPFSTKKALLFFSLPLFLTGILGNVMSWSDTLMLGYFKEEAIVGIYNAAIPLASLIPIFLSAVVFLYVPIASQLHAKKQNEILKRNYAILTKWIFSATLPIFLVLFLFPETILSFFLGASYVGAAGPLRILSLGFLANTFLGPNGATLIAQGKTKFLMYAAFVSAIMNIIMNLLLIPLLGVIGAATASAISLVTINIIMSLKLYLYSKIHPFTKNYLKPIIVSIISVLIIYYLAITLLLIKWWMLPILFLLFISLYGFVLLVTKSFDQEDIMILLSIEQKVGIDLHFVKKILRKFV